jgi:adhesin transport system outer membrane protein
MLSSHPRVTATQKTVQASQEGERRAFGAFLPTVTVQGDAGPERVKRPDREVRQQGRDTASLIITQNVYDFGRRSATYEGSKIATGVQEAQLDATVQQLILDGASAYLDVLRSNQLINLAKSNEATIQRQLNLEDERVQRGGGLAVDVLLAKARLQLAKERLVAFTGQLQEAATRYEQVFGRPPAPGSMADPLAPVQLIPPTLPEAIERARTNNPQLAITTRQAELARARREAAEGDFYPRLDLVGKAASERDIDAEPGQRKEFSLLLRATWELFSGFATQAAVAEATYQFAAAKDTAQFANRRTVEDLQAAWSDLMTSRERVALLQNAVNIAGEVFEARDRLRAAGRETAINVLDAENEYYSAQINFVQAAFDARRAAYRVVFAMGMLTPLNLSIVPAPAAN